MEKRRTLATLIGLSGLALSGCTTIKKELGPVESVNAVVAGFSYSPQSLVYGSTTSPTGLLLGTTSVLIPERHIVILDIPEWKKKEYVDNREWYNSFSLGDKVNYFFQRRFRTKYGDDKDRDGKPDILSKKEEKIIPVRLEKKE